MANNWKINAIAGLDGTQSRNQLNSDIKGLARNLDKLKLYAEIDKNQVTQLQNQLKDLQVQLNNVTISDSAINGLVAKINAGLQNINIGNINIGNQSQNVGQQIGNNIAKGIASGVSKTKSELKSFFDLTNFSELNKKIEHLQIDPSALKNYNAILDEVKAKYAEFGQVKITNEQFDNGILEKFKVNIEQVNGDLKETKSFMMTLNDDKDTFVFDGIIKGSESVVQHLDKTKNAVNQTADAINALKDKAKADKIQHSLSVGDYDTQLKAYSTALQKAGMEGQELATKINGAKSALEELRKSATAENIIPSDVDEKFTKLRTEFEKLANDVKNVKFDNSLFADNIKVNDTITRLNEQLRKNGAYSISAKIKIQEWIKELEKGNVAESRLKAINSEVKELHSNMAKLGNIGKSRWQTFTEYVRSFSEWMISSGAVLEVVQGVKTATNNVIKLSNSLLELSKVSDLSEGGLLKVTERAYELSKTVGKTGTQVLDAVTEFKRAGYDMDKSFNMAEAAMVMTNVAENIKETSDAAGTLISVLKGFNMAETDAMKIVDMINSTSNQSPIGFDQLAEGLERTAGTLAQSGNSIQQTIGLLTAGYAQLRNVEKVSQGLITISARIRGVGEDGETIDGLASKMSEDFGKIGVAVENADGSLRSIYQIAQDYSKVLPNLTDKQKQYYAELAAGKHQVTVWNAIVKQFEDAEKATAQAIDSVGSASEENQKYLDSISGKISIFQSAIEKLSNTVLNSKILSFFVDLGTVGVNSLTSLIEKSRELISGFELIGTALGTFIQSKSKSGGLMSC